MKAKFKSVVFTFSLIKSINICFKVARKNMIVQWLIFWYLASLAPPPLTCEYIHSIGHHHLHKKTKHIDIGRHNVHIRGAPPIWMGAKLGFDGTDAEVHNVGKVNPLQWKSLLRILIWELVHIHTDRCSDRTHRGEKVWIEKGGKVIFLNFRKFGWKRLWESLDRKGSES